MMLKFRFKSIVNIFLVLIIAILSTACENPVTDRKDADAVRAVMEKRKKAIETKDIELYKTVIFSGYKDGGSDFNLMIEEMQSHFDNHEQIIFTYQRSSVDMDMNSARMVGQISYKGSDMEKPAYDRERTIFRRVDGEWSISAGIKPGIF